MLFISPSLLSLSHPHFVTLPSPLLPCSSYPPVALPEEAACCLSGDGPVLRCKHVLQACGQASCVIDLLCVEALHALKSTSTNPAGGLAAGRQRRTHPPLFRSLNILNLLRAGILHHLCVKRHAGAGVRACQQHDGQRPRSSDLLTPCPAFLSCSFISPSPPPFTILYTYAASNCNSGGFIDSAFCQLAPHLSAVQLSPDALLQGDVQTDTTYLCVCARPCACLDVGCVNLGACVWV